MGFAEKAATGSETTMSTPNRSAKLAAIVSHEKHFSTLASSICQESIHGAGWAARGEGYCVAELGCALDAKERLESRSGRDRRNHPLSSRQREAAWR